jgi:hypothetical protein
MHPFNHDLTEAYYTLKPFQPETAREWRTKFGLYALTADTIPPEAMRDHEQLLRFDHAF